MTDRELLERAAKAAGFDAIWFSEMHEHMFARVGEKADPWNPLTDDGDALRLAVKLGLIVDPHGLHTRVQLPFEGEAMAYETHNGDPYAATRRAIVRAAAAMADDAKPK